MSKLTKSILGTGVLLTTTIMAANAMANSADTTKAQGEQKGTYAHVVQMSKHKTFNFICRSTADGVIQWFAEPDDSKYPTSSDCTASTVEYGYSTDLNLHYRQLDGYTITVNNMPQ